MKKAVNWSLAQAWNAVAFKEQKPLKKRDYVYASELGMPLYDRYLKMKAVPYTNPPNDRSLRKFLAGNLMEHVVKQILICSGVYAMDEVVVNAAPYPDTLEVHGRCDFKTIGGMIDSSRAFLGLDALKLPNSLYSVGKGIIDSLAGVFLQEKILELKSVSTFAMDKVERVGAPMANHTLQAYHYQKNSGIPADICYCCRDDLRMRQFPVDAQTSEMPYYADLREITVYWKKKKTPPLDPPFEFDQVSGKFVKNIMVEYSPYLQHYGHETPDHFRNSLSFLASWNRTVDRYVMAELNMTTPTGKPINITPKNKETKADIEKKTKMKFSKIVETRRLSGGFNEEDNE